MKLGLSGKLFLAVVGTVALAVLLVGLSTRWNFTRGFIGYLDEVAAERMEFVLPRLARAYAENGSWAFMRSGGANAWFSLLRPVVGDELSASAPMLPGRRLASDLTGAAVRLGLLDTQFQWVAGFRDINAQMPRQPVVVLGQTVGWLVLAPFQSVSDSGEQRFREGQQRATLATVAMALLLAGLIAWWMSRRLLAPVQRVARATHQLASGDHAVRVAVASDDEVGQLARDFNHLAQTLERNQALRREFVADVSHELRTPLAVLRGELEALEDGVRPFDRAAVASLQGEVKQLGQLVDDLYELVLSDVGSLAYRMAPVDLVDVLARAADAHRARFDQAGLVLTAEVSGSGLMLKADEGRLRQLFDNLLENSRRYTDATDATGAPGQVRLAARRDGATLHIELHDSAPGVAAEVRERLFDRFYRAEGSRSRMTGGAGLGLAIARNIVQAHGGSIRALGSPLGGVCITIELPAAVA